MDFTDLSLSLTILDLVEKYHSLNSHLKEEFTTFLKQEYYAMDDEYSVIFENIFFYLEKRMKKDELDYHLNNLISFVDKDKLEMCIQSCIHYFEDYYN